MRESLRRRRCAADLHVGVDDAGRQRNDACTIRSCGLVECHRPRQVVHSRLGGAVAAETGHCPAPEARRDVEDRRGSRHRAVARRKAALSNSGASRPTRIALWTLVVWFFVVMDMLDGAMARQRGTPVRSEGCSTRSATGSPTAPCSRRLLVGAGENDRPLLAALARLPGRGAGRVLRQGARRGRRAARRRRPARAHRAPRDRPGRLGLTGLGVPYALDVALWLLAVGSLVTVAQRLVAVTRSAREHVDAPDGGR